MQGWQNSQRSDPPHWLLVLSSGHETISGIQVLRREFSLSALVRPWANWFLQEPGICPIMRLTAWCSFTSSTIFPLHSKVVEVFHVEVIGTLPHSRRRRKFSTKAAASQWCTCCTKLKTWMKPLTFRGMVTLWRSLSTLKGSSSSKGALISNWLNVVSKAEFHFPWHRWAMWKLPPRHCLSATETPAQSASLLARC